MMKMSNSKMIGRRAICLCLLAAMLLFAFGAIAEETSPMIGEWAYEYEPESLALAVREDGTAWFQDTECECEDLGDALLLVDEEGVMMMLRYTVKDGKRVIYPQTIYQRGQEVEGQGGLIGVWEGINSGSSYVFTPSGKFLEDSVFTGDFTMDPENGTFLLHYDEAFADTICYYTIENDEYLTVEYPWPIVEKQ